MTIEQIEQCDRCGEYFPALHGTHNCRPGVLAIPYKRRVIFKGNEEEPRKSATDLVLAIAAANDAQNSTTCVDGLFCWTQAAAKDVLKAYQKLDWVLRSGSRPSDNAVTPSTPEMG